MTIKTQEQEKRLIELRKAKVIELLSKGYTSQVEIAKSLNISESTITRDIQEIRKESRAILQEYFEQDLPTELLKTRHLCDAIIKDAYDIIKNSEDSRTKVDSLRLIHNVAISKKDLMLDIKAMDQVIALVVEAKQKLQLKEKEQEQSTIDTDTDTTTEEETEEVNSK